MNDQNTTITTTIIDKWTATVRIRWDANQLSESEVCNLLATAGCLVGIGNARPGSKSLPSGPWGTFEVMP